MALQGESLVTRTVATGDYYTVLRASGNVEAYDSSDSLVSTLRAAEFHNLDGTVAVRDASGAVTAWSGGEPVQQGTAPGRSSMPTGPSRPMTPRAS